MLTKQKITFSQSTLTVKQLGKLITTATTNSSTNNRLGTQTMHSFKKDIVGKER